MCCPCFALERKEILISLLDASGQVVSYAGPVLFKGTHITADGWLAEALERGSGVGDVRTGQQMGVAHYAVARRITRGDSAYVLRASPTPRPLAGCFARCAMTDWTSS